MKITEMSEKQTQLNETMVDSRHHPLFGIHRGHPNHEDYMQALAHLKDTDPVAYQKAISLD